MQLSRIHIIVVLLFSVSVSFVGVVKTLQLNDESVARIYSAVKRIKETVDLEGAVRQTLAEACVVDKSRWEDI
jgi:hypothetical protein